QAKLGEIYFHGRLDSDATAVGTQCDEAQSSGLSFAFANSGVKPNLAESYRWNQMAAEEGDAASQVRLGYQYATGQGVPQDFAKAEEWFNKATKNGHSGGALGIALLYAGGHGRPANLGHA